MEQEPKQQQSVDKKNKMGIGMALGIPIGVALGVAMDNISVGIAIGVALGAGIGASSNSSTEFNEKHRRLILLISIILGLLFFVGILTFVLVRRNS